DSVNLLSFRGEHQNRNVPRRRLALQHLANIKPAHPGQHEIKDDQRRETSPCLLQGRFTVLRLEHLIAGGLEVCRNQVEDVLLVFGDQDLFVAGFLTHSVAKKCRAFERSASRCVSQSCYTGASELPQREHATSVPDSTWR